MGVNWQFWTDQPPSPVNPPPAPPPLIVEGAALPTEDQTWIMLTGLGISIAWAANLIYAHVEPHVWYDRQQRWVLFMCFLAYLIAWVPVWLLPFDLVGTEARHAERRRCSELGLSWLAFLWWMVYATNLAAGYLTYDFARSYLDAGGFTVRRRLILALVDIRDWYSVAFLICVAIIFAVAFFSDQVFVWSFWDLLASIIYALANFYAVGLFIWLLSHALVELPRRLWYLPDLETHKRYACFTAGIAWEDLEKARPDWDEAVERLILTTAYITENPDNNKRPNASSVTGMGRRVSSSSYAAGAAEPSSSGGGGCGGSGGGGGSSRPRSPLSSNMSSPRRLEHPIPSRYLPVLRILREEWRVTEATVRSMPIASGRWPRDPPPPPEPESYLPGGGGRGSRQASPPKTPYTNARHITSLPQEEEPLLPVWLTEPDYLKDPDAAAAAARQSFHAAAGSPPAAPDLNSAVSPTTSTTSGLPTNLHPSLLKERSLGTPHATPRDSVDGEDTKMGSGVSVDGIDLSEVLALEAANQHLKRAAFVWRRANRTFEAQTRRMLRLHRTRLPAYAPGVLLPATTFLGFLGAATRHTIYRTLQLVARIVAWFFALMDSIVAAIWAAIQYVFDLRDRIINWFVEKWSNFCDWWYSVWNPIAEKVGAIAASPFVKTNVAPAFSKISEKGGDLIKTTVAPAINRGVSKGGEELSKLGVKAKAKTAEAVAPAVGAVTRARDEAVQAALKKLEPARRRLERAYTDGEKAIAGAKASLMELEDKLLLERESSSKEGGGKNGSGNGSGHNGSRYRSQSGNGENDDYNVLTASEISHRATRRRVRISGLAVKAYAAVRTLFSLSLWAVLSTVFSLILLSELFLIFQFPQFYSWSAPAPPMDAPGGQIPTPLGLLLSWGKGPEDINEVALLCLAMTLLLSCAWSLSTIEMGFFWYRMAPGYATDTSSLAFNSAVFCRIAVILVLNVDMLVLPTEANGIRTTQTRFYCQFGRKARLLVPLTNGHDYYLIAMPLLLLLLVLALYCNLLARLRALFSRLTHDERAATFRFGRTTVPWHEDKGKELLHELEEANRAWAVGIVQYYARRKLMILHPTGHARKLFNTLDRSMRSLSFDASRIPGGLAGLQTPQNPMERRKSLSARTRAEAMGDGPGHLSDRAPLETATTGPRRSSLSRQGSSSALADPSRAGHAASLL